MDLKPRNIYIDLCKAMTIGNYLIPQKNFCIVFLETYVLLKHRFRPTFLPEQPPIEFREIFLASMNRAHRKHKVNFFYRKGIQTSEFQSHKSASKFLTEERVDFLWKTVSENYYSLVGYIIAKKNKSLPNLINIEHPLQVLTREECELIDCYLRDKFLLDYVTSEILSIVGNITTSYFRCHAKKYRAALSDKNYISANYIFSNLVHSLDKSNDNWLSKLDWVNK